MAMEEIWRFILFDETIESFESSMTKVFCVIDMAGRRMGKYKIGTSASPERIAHLADELTHFFFGILIYTAVIPSTPRKPDKLPLFECHYPSVNAAAAERRGGFIADIVVAEYIKQRHLVPED